MCLVWINFKDTILSEDSKLKNGVCRLIPSCECLKHAWCILFIDTCVSCEWNSTDMVPHQVCDWGRLLGVITGSGT